jgi:hypothetical protein
VAHFPPSHYRAMDAGVSTESFVQDLAERPNDPPNSAITIGKSREAGRTLAEAMSF